MPEPYTLFISDLHLYEERPGFNNKITQAFLAFIEEQASQSEALYILGDFFNVWIGDDDDSPLIHTVAKTLNSLTQNGTAVYLMHGNRDFLMGDQFTKQCGASLIEDPCPVSLYGKQYLLMHGDSLCTQDTDYLAFRQMVRDKNWQANFLSQSLEDRRTFADQARAQSKSMSSNKAEDIMDVTASAVDEVMNKYNVNTLIHGHTHRPAIHDLENGARRIVLGDWNEDGFYYYKISQNQEDLLQYGF